VWFAGKIMNRKSTKRTLMDLNVDYLWQNTVIGSGELGRER